ncbi:restriction endonuclease subunit S [Aminobacter sp. MET-1]|uniref:restriction endonuclease subunit S n=1 Tax=Aminobacter sp. MET-1 TaxID=2951085 RepID=UPI00226A1313|nr:restriction endonuclease subunit S [Aminobacter sp. MET-1]MCX8568787.1 restriction endonuclease subunit S [Aminobacter sp. MET-1]
MDDVLPPTWTLVPLSQAVVVSKGRRPFELGPRSAERTIPYITISAFETGEATDYAPEQGLPEITSADTLLVWDGARAGLVGRSEHGYAGSTIARLTPVLVDPEYLYRFMQASFGELNSRTKGAGIPHIDPEVLNALSFPLAPLEEQRAVALRLDELLNGLDRAQTEVDGARRSAAMAWTSALVSAMRGELTAGLRRDRNDQHQTLHSGHALLEQIKRVRAEKMGDTEEGDEDAAPLPSSLPSEWTWSTLGECFDIMVGATPSRRRPDFWNGSIPWVSSGEVRFNRIRATRELISEIGLRHSSTQLNPPGSILLGMIGEGKTRGQVAILDIAAANNQNCAAIHVSKTEIPPEFVFYWLWSRYQQTRVVSVGNNQPALNRTIISRMPIPIPPLWEMHAIVDALDIARVQSEQFERAATETLQRTKVQRQSILAAAFSGKLTPRIEGVEGGDALINHMHAARLNIREANTRRVAVTRRSKKKVNQTLEAVLKDAGGWILAQEAFRRCGVADEVLTDYVETLYRELSRLERSGAIAVQAVYDDAGRKIEDRIRLVEKSNAA